MANEAADEIAELKRRIEAIEKLLKIETSPAPGPSPDRQETDSVRDRVLNVALSPQAGAGKSFRYHGSDRKRAHHAASKSRLTADEVGRDWQASTNPFSISQGSSE